MTALPSTYTYGVIRGRIIQWILDTLDDDDHQPDARPAVGRVILTPHEQLRRVTNADYSALVTSGRMILDLPADGDGTLRDAHGRDLITIVTGTYDVAFDLTTGIIPTFTIVVTADHTPDNPLDLAAAAPPPTNPDATQLLPVPAGGQPGQVLHMTTDGLAWGYPAAGPDGLPLVKVQPNQAEGATVAGSLDLWRVGDTIFAQFKFVRISGWTRWETVFIVPPGYGGTGTYVYVTDSPGGAPGFYISGRNLQLVGESTGELRGTVAWRAGELMPESGQS